MTHLHPDAVQISLKPKKERINHILSTKWIGYPKAREVLNRLEELMEHPITHRMPNILIVGDTNNGKTAIINRFKKLYPASVPEEGEHVNVPVLMVQAPSSPDEKRFYNNILDQLFTPYRVNDNVDKKLNQVLHILKHVSLKILIIDEINHLVAGPSRKQRVFLNVLKYISNELQISLVCAGTIEAYNAINSDPQMANRFARINLPRWSMGEEYVKLLSSFESIIPLKESSNLANPELAQKILGMSEGLIGEISDIVKKAAVTALKNDEERITKKILDSIDYQSPSERKVISYK